MASTGSIDRIAIVPLVGNIESAEAHAMGTLLSKLLAEHMQAAGMNILDHSTVARHIVADKLQLPLNAENRQALRARLNLGVVIHGRYTIDEDGDLLGLRLSCDGPGISPAPMEAATPFNGYGKFIARVSLALIEQVGLTVTDSIRQKVNSVYRPARLEAIQQLASAHVAWNKGQKEMALAAVSSALTLDPEYEAAATLEVAAARDASDTITTREAFRRWAKIAIKHGRLLVAAERMMQLGHWLTERGEWPEARRAYEDARDIFQREDNDIGKSRALNNLANLDLYSGKMQSAIKTYRRSLRVFETDPDTRSDTAVTLFNLALAHKSLGQREEAMNSIEQALTLARRLNDTQLSARCLAQRGALCEDTGEWTKAADDYNQAEKLFDVIGDEQGIALVKSHQALLLRQQGEFERAETLMLDAVQVFNTDAPPHEQGVLYLNLADLYFVMQLYDQAWEYAERAHAILTRLKSHWVERSRSLLSALEDIPEEPAEEEPFADASSPEEESFSTEENSYTSPSMFDDKDAFDIGSGSDPIRR